MIDLSRLKISEQARKGITFNKSSFCFFCIFIIIFFFIGHYAPIQFPWEKHVHTIQTLIARKAQPITLSAFTAGGWIEVATPQYPQKIVAQIMNERIERIFVKEGDIVKPGQIVATLFNHNKKYALDLANAELIAAKTELKKLKNGYRQEEIDEAKHHVQDLDEQLKIAKINLHRSEKQGAGVVTQAIIDDQQATVAILEARVKQAKTNFSLLTKGYRQEEIDLAEAHLQKAEANQKLAELNYSFCTIKIPENIPPLTVLKVLAKEGQMTSAENNMSQIMLLYNPKEMQVRADIRQQNIKQVKIGGPVKIKTDADIFHEYQGTILRIDPEADIAKNTVSVKIKINNPDKYLFPEMVAEIAFLERDSNEEDNNDDEEDYYEVMLLPITAIHQTHDGTYFVWINNNQVAQKKQISIGKKLDNKIEVSGGIEAGTRVIISDTSSIKEGDIVKENP